MMVNLGSWITGIGLILLALQCFVVPWAAEGYGVSPIDENGFAYLLATGMRDLFMGIATLYLLLHHRSALPFFFLAMIVVPLADTLIVLRYGDSLLATGPHVIGLVGLALLSYLAHRENSTENSRPDRQSR